jgi:hypothetical protein
VSVPILCIRFFVFDPGLTRLGCFHNYFDIVNKNYQYTLLPAKSRRVITITIQRGTTRVELLHRRDIPNYRIKIQPNKNNVGVMDSLQPLRSLFSQDQWKDLIKKLFHNQAAEFDDLIDELESVQSWQQALKKVDQEFKKHHIDLYDRYAVVFRNILYARYFPDDSRIKIK